MLSRLSMFPVARIEEIRSRIGEATSTGWPQVKGVLCVLFTARSGSTYLCRELEVLFNLGRMGEDLNPVKVETRIGARLEARSGKWLGVKAGLQGVAAGELVGFFDAYLSKTVFIQLVRRDIVAQAVSLEKAEQTGVWHAANEQTGSAAYDGDGIARGLRRTVATVEQLRAYADLTGRPCPTVVYEDFSAGDLSAVAAVCDGLGVPRKKEGAKVRPRPVERVGDAVNEAWIARFTAEMSPEIRDLVDRYHGAIEP